MGWMGLVSVRLTKINKKYMASDVTYCIKTQILDIEI